MYESPIVQTEKIINQSMAQQIENELVWTVEREIGFYVDKNELLKALQYDREQYEKGYADALSKIVDIKAEIECKANNSSGSIGDGLYDALEIIDKYI